MDGLTSQQHLDLLRGLVVGRFPSVRVIQSTSDRRIGADRYELAPRNSVYVQAPVVPSGKPRRPQGAWRYRRQRHRVLDGLRPPPTRLPGGLPDGFGRGPSADKERLIVKGATVMNGVRSISMRKGYLMTALFAAVLLAVSSGTAWAQQLDEISIVLEPPRTMGEGSDATIAVRGTATVLPTPVTGDVASNRVVSVDLTLATSDAVPGSTPVNLTKRAKLMMPGLFPTRGCSWSLQKMRGRQQGGVPPPEPSPCDRTKTPTPNTNV